MNCNNFEAIISDLAREQMLEAHTRESALQHIEECAACADLLAPPAELITQRNAAAGHLHVDETSWQVFAAVEGKDSHRWWCWVFAGPDTTVFTIAPSRSLKVLTAQLGVVVGGDAQLLGENRQRP